MQKSDSDDEDDDDEDDDDENIEDNDEDDDVNDEETNSASTGSNVTGMNNIGKDMMGKEKIVGADNDSDDDDEDFELVNFDDGVPNSRFRYGRVKTSAERKEAHDRYRPAIARIKISAAATASDTASDNTSLSINETDEAGQPNKSGDTIDHLIGHIEGHRPLLDEDEDEEAEPSVSSSTIVAPIPVIRPFIQMDTPPVQSPQEESVPPPPPVSSFNLGNNGDALLFSSPSDNANTFEAFTLQQIIDETEENLRLDQEVERSLTQQVIRDQMNHKDLFGSIPFTDKDLMVNEMIMFFNVFNVTFLPG